MSQITDAEIEAACAAAAVEKAVAEERERASAASRARYDRLWNTVAKELPTKFMAGELAGLTGMLNEAEAAIRDRSKP